MPTVICRCVGGVSNIDLRFSVPGMDAWSLDQALDKGIQRPRERGVVVAHELHALGDRRHRDGEVLRLDTLVGPLQRVSARSDEHITVLVTLAASRSQHSGHARGHVKHVLIRGNPTIKRVTGTACSLRAGELLSRSQDVPEVG